MAQHILYVIECFIMFEEIYVFASIGYVIIN